MPRRGEYGSFRRISGGGQPLKAFFGSNWWLGSTVDLRVITDTSDPRNVYHATLLKLVERGSVRSIAGVHAKLYVIDDLALVTSANLTQTAFTKRREVGVLLEPTEVAGAARIFEQWWNDPAAQIIDDATVVKWEAGSASLLKPEDDCPALPSLWDLPPAPPESAFAPPDQATKSFAHYQRFLKHYAGFAAIYESQQRLWLESPLYLETDAFLDYLFHHAEGTPSKEFYDKNTPRRLTSTEQKQEVARLAETFAVWISLESDARWREEHAQTVQDLLRPEHIDDLTLQEAREVLDCLNCMNARQLNKHRFLNPVNNSLSNIIAEWKNLLHGKDHEEHRMHQCADALRFFGTSSIQDLLGWYYPNRYPIRNYNADAGLRYLGFRV